MCSAEIDVITSGNAFDAFKNLISMFLMQLKISYLYMYIIYFPSLLCLVDNHRVNKSINLNSNKLFVCSTMSGFQQETILFCIQEFIG